MRQIVVWNLKNRDLLYAPYATREMFACGIRYPGLWNPEYNSSNAELPKNWNPDSKFHWQRIHNPLPGIRNPRHETQNRRLSWISFHGAIV